MKPGDLVRFKMERYERLKPEHCGIWDMKIGILLEYHSWEKVASVFCDGKVYRVHGSEVQKAGKKDEERYNSESK